MTRKRELILAVYTPTALLAFAQGLLLATLPLYAANFDVSYTVISLAVSAAAIGSLATDLPAGFVLHRVGLRNAMIVGTAMVSLSTLILGLPERIGILIVLRLLAGVGTTLWGLSRHAYIAQAVPRETRGRSIATFGGINRIGAFGGPVVGGIIGSRISLEASFVIAGLMGLLALAAAIRFIPAELQLEAAPSHSKQTRWQVARAAVRTHHRDLLAAGTAQMFAQMIRQGRQLLIPLLGATELGLDAAQIGLAMTVSAVFDMSMFVPAGFLMDRFGRKAAAVPSFAIMAIGVAMLPLVSTFTGLVLASALIGFGNGLGSGTMMTLGADLAPPGATGEFLGIWRLIGDLGQVAGPMAVGVLASLFGLHGSAIVLAGIGLLASLTLLFLVKETYRLEPVAV